MSRRFLLMAREIVPVLIIILLVVGANRTIVQNVEVKGSSMLPTLRENERVLVDLMSYRLHAPRRGDIVILHPPVAPNDDFVKRVIGLPGDLVQVKAGRVYIGGRPLVEPYLHERHTYSWGPRRVPPDSLFVLGDNRDPSYDSHDWSTPEQGPVPFLSEKQVIGRVMLVYWPLKAAQIFSAPSFALSGSSAPASRLQ